MSELKFICPSCEQHIQCERALAGDKIHCPTCKAELRVPVSDTVVNPKVSLPRAELLVIPPSMARSSLPDKPIVDSDPITVSRETTQPTTPTTPAITPPPPIAPAPPSTPPQSAMTPTPTRDVHLDVTCPVCHSELRIPVVPQPGDPRIAEVAPREPAPPTPLEAAIKAVEPAISNAAVSNSKLDHIAPTERERQIAAARAAHPISVYPTIKPRLAYILRGEAPPPGTAESAPPPSTEPIDKNKPPEPPIETVTE